MTISRESLIAMRDAAPPRSGRPGVVVGGRPGRPRATGGSRSSTCRPAAISRWRTRTGDCRSSSTARSTTTSSSRGAASARPRFRTRTRHRGHPRRVRRSGGRTASRGSTACSRFALYDPGDRERLPRARSAPARSRCSTAHDGGDARLRLGDEGAARRSRRARGARRRGARRTTSRSATSAASDCLLDGHPEAAAGPRARASTSRPGRRGTGPYWSLPTDGALSASDEELDGAREAAARLGAAPADRRRAGRHHPERRHRLEPRHGDGGAGLVRAASRRSPSRFPATARSTRRRTRAAVGEALRDRAHRARRRAGDRRSAARARPPVSTSRSPTRRWCRRTSSRG